MSKSKLLKFFTSAAFLCASLSVQATPVTVDLVKDHWTDGSRTDPSAADGYAENNGSLGTDADADGDLEAQFFNTGTSSTSIATSGKLTTTAGSGASQSVYSYFTPESTPVSLSHPGDKLTVKWVFTPKGTITTNTSQAFVVAVAKTPSGSRVIADGSVPSAAYKGYAMFMNMAPTLGNGNPFQLRSWALGTGVSGALLGTGANWTALVNGATTGNTGYAVDTTYTLTMTFTRDAITPANLNIECTMTGGNLNGVTGGLASVSYVDAAPNTFVFDTFDFRPGTPATTATSFETTLFQVTYTTDVPAPTISTQPSPSSQTIAAGGTATYSVVAAGTGPFTYRWKKDGNDLTDASGHIAGATTSSLSLSSIVSGDAGSYTVVVTNSGGNVTSDAAVLSVATAPPIPTASAATGTTAASFSANWAASTGATGYLLDVATDNGFTSFVSGYNDKDVGNVLTSAVSGLVANTNYYYRVRAYNTIATSASSSTIAVTTLVPSPTVSAASAVAASGFSANWNSVSGATTYQLDVATDSGFTSLLTSFSSLNVGNVTTASVTGLTDNTTYYFRVRALIGAASSASSGTGTALTLPAISAQPSPQSVLVGANPTFTVSSNNATGLTYQWKRGGIDIPGETAASYTLSSAQLGDNGASFSVVVSNTSGSVTSTSALLSVTLSVSAPTVTTPPATQTVNQGTSVTFSVVVSGTAPFTYQWQKKPVSGSFADISGATGATLQLTNVQAADGGDYRVTASNSAGSDTSAAATLVVVVAPSAPTPNAASGLTTSGFTANWTATSGATGYRLDVSTSNTFASFVPGFNDLDVGNVTTKAVTGLSENTSYYYRVRAYNAAGTSNSSTTTTAVTSASTLSITTQPTGQSALEGGNVTFTVVASSVSALSYQWKRNGTDIPGATAATLNVSNVQLTDSGNSYTVVVTNAAGSVTSSAAVLTVNVAPPTIATHPQTQSALLGTRAVFAVRATGSGPFTYQWKKNGSDLSGATDLSLVLTNLQSSDAASYTVAVTNSGGTVTSSAGVLTVVTPAVTLPTQPTIPSGVFRVTNYGAIGDGATDNTTAIQAAINAATAAGGGTVELPPASRAYLTGPLTLGSNLNLQIDGGAILQALPMTSATLPIYPGTLTSRNNLITFSSGATNVAITGTGTIEGDGSAWWAAYDNNSSTDRPRLVQFTKSTNVLLSGVTLQNSPQFHIAMSGSGGTPNTNVTAFGLTINAPGTSTNTDGLDPTAVNILIQKCTISVGDDNIAIKAQNGNCASMTIADCAFGTGHGLSVGGQTNFGLDGLTVTNCTFNGTTSGLRLKANPTEGGVVQNLSYSNISMTNVTYPIVFYSYYDVSGFGNPADDTTQTPTKVRVTSATVLANNQTPPNALNSSTLPVWKNITISNLTATGSGSSIIWGLPLASGLISNVTLTDVILSGLKVFNSTNVQLTGASVVGALATANALVITGQPAAKSIASGESATFNITAVGTSLVNGTGVTYQWKKDGTVLTDGTQANGTKISGATTASLTIDNAQPGYSGSYACTVSNNLDGYNTSTSTLVASSLAVSATSSSALLSVSGIGTAPTIVDQPVNATTVLGQDATFTVNAASETALTYQWYSGNPASSYVPIVDSSIFFGSTQKQLLIRNVQAAQAGTYFAIVTNASGPTTTLVARLSVVKTPSITQQPVAQALYIGAKLTLTVAVAGDAPFIYEWKREDVPLANDSRISGVTTNTLTITGAQVADSGRYSIRIYNAYGSILSDAVTVSVTPVPTAPLAPVANAATSVDSNSFVVSWNSAATAAGYRLDVATNSGFTTFVTGYKDLDVGQNLSQVIANIKSLTTFYVRVRAYNAVGNSPYSNTITVSTLDVKVAPKFTSPTSTTFTLGLASNFTVTASGKPTPTLAATGLPSWVSFAPGTGLLTGTPPAGTANGQFVINFTATNGVPPDAAQVFTLSVQAPPAVTTPMLISTFAGLAGASGTTNDTGTAARFNNPADVTVDAAGNIYVADTDNHTIRKITSAGVVTVLAGSAGTSGTTTGAGGSARFNTPAGVAIDPTGANIYTADTLNHVIRKVTSGGTMTAVAGSAGNSGSADGAGNVARFFAPQGLAVSPDGKLLYVADTNNHTIRVIDLGTATVSTFAGVAGVSGSADGTGNGARFNAPSDVAVDTNGNIYVADTDNNTIRTITPNGVVTTLAGLAGSAGAADGTGSGARFNHPGSLTVDSNFNIFVLDTDNHTIRKIVSAAGVVTTVAGQAGSIGSTDGSGATVRFNYPSGITVNPAGSFYIADTANHLIRAGAIPGGPVITSQPQGTTVTAGATVQLFVTASGQPEPTYQWRFNGSAITGATSSSLTLSGIQTSQSGKYTVVVTNTQGSVTSNEATVTVDAPAGSGGSTGGGSGGSSGGGGGGGAPSTWFYSALLLLVLGRALRRRTVNPAL